MAPRALDVAVVPVSAMPASMDSDLKQPGSATPVVVRLSSYFEPADPWRLKVELVRAEDVRTKHKSSHGTDAPALAVLSVNLPNMPNPGPRTFFFKTWAENEGLLEALVDAGVVRVLNLAGVPVGMVKAMEVEIAWADKDLLVCLETDAHKLHDWQRFFSHTYIQHLGM